MGARLGLTEEQFNEKDPHDVRTKFVHQLHHARERLVDNGELYDPEVAGHGVWEVTPEGQDRYQKDVEESAVALMDTLDISVQEDQEAVEVTSLPQMESNGREARMQARREGIRQMEEKIEKIEQEEEDALDREWDRVKQKLEEAEARRRSREK
jgi:hypothetical protein